MGMDLWLPWQLKKESLKSWKSSNDIKIDLSKGYRLPKVSGSKDKNSTNTNSNVTACFQIRNALDSQEGVGPNLHNKIISYMGITAAQMI